MCGLLAFVGPVDSHEFEMALHLQLHRGPDDWGVEVNNGVTLGHRRLSIIDLASHASQPMYCANNEIVGVFNGEIYNFKELRSDLIEKGYRFTTSGDTEVLLNAFHCYREKVLDKLIGMFAFVIHDLINNEIFAARDRLGIKPLFYSEMEDGICFSSEVKSIVSLDKRSDFSLDLQSVSAYLSYRYPLIDRTFIEGIKQLEPGHYISLKSGVMSKVEYWDCSEFVKEQSQDKGEVYYIARLRELFASSVKYRMISDVPVGAYLSGGVDSSAVVAQMSKETSSTISTFTIGFDEEGFNEFEYSREVAKQYGTDHQEIIISSQDYFETMMKLIDIKDAPLGVPNEVPLYLMSKELKKKVTVVLSGEGADEIFGGYGRLFRSADDYQKLKSGRDKLSETFLNKYPETVCLDSELEHFLHLYRYTSKRNKEELFTDRVNKMNLDHLLDEYFRKAFEKVSGAPYATKMMYAFEKLHLPGLLQRVDITTMGASVEARVPFVDHRLVEFAFTIPEKYKLKWLEEPEKFASLCGDEISESYDVPKYILKKTFEGDLSDNILYRKKMGFPVPLSKFMGGDNLATVVNEVANGELVKQDIIDKEKVLSFFTEDSLRNSKHAMTAWMLLNLEKYLSRLCAQVKMNG